MPPPTQRLGSWRPGLGLAMVSAMIALILCACGAALWLVDERGKELIAAQETDALTDELDLFSAIYHDEGIEGLSRAIARRVDLQGEHQIYALADADRNVVTGNLLSWPRTIVGDVSSNRIEDPDGRGSLRVSTRSIDNNLIILVGRDSDVEDTFQSTIIDAVWVAIAIVAVTCLLIATVVTALIMGRVRDLSAAAARVTAGDFTARAARENEPGPFGDIARAQNAMLERIEDLVTGLKTITDSLAHDLRTPLARTRRRIEDGVLAPDMQGKQEALEGALTETDRTIATFTGLIDIARAEGGLSREAMSPVDLAAITRDVFDLFEPLAEERALRFSLHAADISIIGHKALLMQAVSNLVHNAIKFSPQGGCVELEVAETADGAAITVTDNGPGIATDRRADAVQRFKQIGAGDNPEGLGLGLAIVEACARLHRGRLALEDNAPGLRARLVLARI